MSNCPYCGKSFRKRQPCADHINSYHSAELEKSGLDAYQAMYKATHGTIEGRCMACGRPTQWNTRTGKPFKVCNDPNCRKKLAAKAEANMQAARGVSVHSLLHDMEHQKMMLANRHTSGEYKFADGGKVGYASQLEKSFLKFCDQIMDLTSNMIQEPPEVFTYFDKKENIERQYMPDYYFPDYNLIVEIKDAGNTNPAFVEETKYKVALKDEVMKKQTKYNFIRINGTNYGPFVEALYQIVHEQEPDDTKRNSLVFITESACVEPDDGLNYTAPDIPDENTPLILMIGFFPGGMHKYTAMTTSRQLVNWMKSSVVDHELSATSFKDPDFREGDFQAYKYVGREPIQEACVTLQKLEEAVGVHQWDILQVLAENGIMFDNGHGVANNTNHQMMFTKVDLNSILEEVGL